jgi:NADH:ubiquinone oxidoreductase subunit
MPQLHMHSQLHHLNQQHPVYSQFSQRQQQPSMTLNPQTGQKRPSSVLDDDPRKRAYIMPHQL